MVSESLLRLFRWRDIDSDLFPWFQFSNGDLYEGDWSMGAKNGKGMYRCCNGVIYDGRWKDDMRHGFGTCTYANGDEYKGKWAKNQKHGDGVYTFRKFTP